MDRLWQELHQYAERLSLPDHGNTWQRYGIVFLLLAFFFSIKTVLSTALGVDVPFLFSLFIVILSAWLSGFGPAILATVLSGAITYYFFLEPKWTLLGSQNIPNLFVLLVFYLEGLFITVLTDSQRKNERQKSEFIGMISHELKNPLTSIRGYADLIQRLVARKNEGKIMTYAESIRRQSEQVVSMINELLDITKIETGRLTYQDERFKLEELVQEIVSDQQVTTKTHVIHCSVRGSMTVLADRYRIGQVVTNLLSNAIKYSPGAQKIEVSLRQKGQRALLLVRDFGVGIPYSDQPKLFQPFFRAGNSGSAKGTGVGLYISQQIVNRHKGKLWVASKPGKGSVFYLELMIDANSIKKKRGENE